MVTDVLASTTILHALNALIPIAHIIFIIYAIIYLAFFDKKRKKLNILLLICLIIMIAIISFFSTNHLHFINYAIDYLFCYIGLISFMSWRSTTKRQRVLYVPFLIAVSSYTIYTLYNTVLNIVNPTNGNSTPVIVTFIYLILFILPNILIFIIHSFSKLKNRHSKKPKKQTVIFVASAGGHLTQIMALNPIFSRYNSYLVTEKTPIHLKSSIPIKYVLYCSRKQPFPYFFKSIINTCRSFYLFAAINPDVIITTGTHTAIPLCLFGWLFRRKVIYIESFAKNSSPTLAGHFIYPFADTFIIQWKNMKDFYPRAKYFGGIY